MVRNFTKFYQTLYFVVRKLINIDTERRITRIPKPINQIGIFGWTEHVCKETIPLKISLIKDKLILKYEYARSTLPIVIIEIDQKSKKIPKK